MWLALIQICNSDVQFRRVNQPAADLPLLIAHNHDKDHQVWSILSIGLLVIIVLLLLDPM